MQTCTHTHTHTHIHTQTHTHTYTCYITQCSLESHIDKDRKGWDDNYEIKPHLVVLQIELIEDCWAKR